MSCAFLGFFEPAFILRGYCTVQMLLFLNSILNIFKEYFVILSNTTNCFSRQNAKALMATEVALFFH